MGAGNAKLAYGHYAGQVSAGSLLALAERMRQRIGGRR